MASFSLSEIKKITAGQCLGEGRRSSFTGVTIDSRAVKKGNIFIAIVGVNRDGHDFIDEAVKKGAAAVIISKKITVPSGIWVICVKDTTKALGALAAAHRLRFNYPVIAITGSAGKTSSKELIFAVLSRRYRVLKSKGSFNNHWGVPLTLLNMNDKYQATILELGTNHPGEIGYLTRMTRPDIVVLTNVGPCHLEGLKTVDDVYREKKSIIDGLPVNGTVIFNQDDPYLKRLKRLGKKQLYSYGLKGQADFAADYIRINKNGTLNFILNKRYPVKLRTPVRENVSNALSAVACGRKLNVPFDDIVKGLGRCSFKQQRQQIERVGGLIIINDSYNANPVSFRSALTTLKNFPVKGRRIAVCADMLELGKDAVRLHEELADVLSAGGVDIILSLGPMMKHFVRKVRRFCPDIKTCCFDDIRQLNTMLVKTAAEGDVILVKGSRGMRTEGCVDFLKKKFS